MNSNKKLDFGLLIHVQWNSSAVVQIVNKSLV